MTADIQAIAREVIGSLSGHPQVATFASRPGGLTTAQAYRVTPLLRAAFESRGETIVGRKIGFTNRRMWKEFGIDSPVWGYVTDRTRHELADAAVFSLSGFAEPRIEPEIMFGLGAAPVPGMDDTALLGCVEWIALGYEIVQSIFPGWQFSAADAVAANALHGALLIGTRHAIAPRAPAWQHELSTFDVDLCRDGRPVQRGGGSLVLGSPLGALGHLVGLLANAPHNPPLGAGEIVSTGTLTLAMPVKPGELWTARPRGLPLEDIAIRFDG